MLTCDNFLSLDMDTVERFMERAQYSIPKENVTSLGNTFSSLEECKLAFSGSEVFV